MDCKALILLFALNTIRLSSFAQLAYVEPDTLKKRELPPISITDSVISGNISRMPALKEHVIYAAKKNEVIKLDNIAADLSVNTTRQVFAKSPGISVWENDGSGIQVGVATRGLSPNRSWEFNVRQNGADVSSEIFGYPEAYYTPPMEAVEQIEVVRGAASLQFGPQFGGLLNFRMKKAPEGKGFHFETRQTLGSYNLFNSFNAIGINQGKFSFYGYYHQRTADGWRENGQYRFQNGYFSMVYKFNDKTRIEADYSRMNYVMQQSGGLTDAQFAENARQSSRERNWFSTPWNVASLTWHCQINKNFGFQWKIFTTIAERNSVGFVAPITTHDTINAATLSYNPRQIDRDAYNNIGSEFRSTYQYNLAGNKSVLAAGLRAYRGNTERRQNGKGTTGSDFDLTLMAPTFGRELSFQTLNGALFVENIFNVSKRLRVVPGARYEWIENSREGFINTTPQGMLPNDTRVRQVLLYGVGAELAILEGTQFYANYSRAFRPVTFSELTPSAQTDIIDPNLKDAQGFNADIGYRGKWKNFLQFDVGAFYLLYDNRIGNVTRDGNVFRTNVGTSVSQGVESYVEIELFSAFKAPKSWGKLSIFSSNSWIDARYRTWNNPDIINDASKSIEGKRVENAAPYIHRAGFQYNLYGLQLALTWSSVGAVFTDAANTEKANAAATVGKLQAYQLADLHVSYAFSNNYNFSAGINNLANQMYATRRAGGYPGPGIIPGTGRTAFVSFGARF